MQLTTRLRILNYLRKQQAASVRELSRALGLTGANIRHHLGVLETSDLIELIGQRRYGRGRPENIFALSRRVLGDGLDELAGAMVEVWLRKATDEARDAGLRSLALRMSGENPPGPGILLPYRLNLMVDRLNKLHYEARWEAGADGPRVILGHCPYAAIIASYPELCFVDTFMLEQQTGLPVDQTAKLQAGAKGYPYCAFRISGGEKISQKG